MATPTTTLREPIKVIADVLQHELGLANGQIVVADQKWNVPKNDGLYISLEYLGPGRTIASINNFDPVSQVEIQGVTMLLTVQIDFMSYDGSARVRKEEIAMALASVYSQQQQEKYECQIALHPGLFNDNSSVEGTAMLQRYTTTAQITSSFSKQKVVEYFDTFGTPEVTVT